MSINRFLAAVAFLMLTVVPARAQQPTVTLHGDDITMRGCITPAGRATMASPTMLVWSRSDIMMAGATVLGTNPSEPVGTSGMAGRVFYWLDNDEDLSKHVGQMVELKGELKDFEKGKYEVKRDGDFTEIKLELDGKEEKARVPTSWLGPASANTEQKVDIVGRKIKVKDVRVLGACDVL